MQKEVEFELTDELAKKLYPIQLYRQYRGKAALMLIVTLGMLVAMEFVRGGTGVLLQMLVMMSLVWSVIGLVYALRLRKAFLGSIASLPHRRFVLRLSNEGVVFVGPEGELRANWNRFRWLKRGNVIWVLQFKDTVGCLFAPSDALDQETRDFIVDKYATRSQPAPVSSLPTSGIGSEAPADGGDALAAEPGGRAVSYEMTDELVERIHRLRIKTFAMAQRSKFIWASLGGVAMLTTFILQRGWIWLGVLFVALAVLWFVMARIEAHRLRSFVRQVRLWPHRRVTLCIGPDGIVVADALSKTRIPWDRVRSVERFEGFLILRRGRNEMLGAFPDEALDDETSEEIQALAAAAGAEIL